MKTPMATKEKISHLFVLVFEESSKGISCMLSMILIKLQIYEDILGKSTGLLRLRVDLVW